MNTSDIFPTRQAFSRAKLEQLRSSLISDAVDPGTACVYAAGSVAREEATEHSDLDLFIVDAADESLGEIPVADLRATLLRADLIRASRAAGFPPFSGDGIYLQMHLITDLVSRTGRPDDDVTNSFTARLLLLLESKPIVNDAAHATAKTRVINSYWRDYQGNSAEFRPVFLINDLVRYWKTLCLNYEADRTLGAPSGYDAVQWRNRNRLKNVKLKFTRLWTCHTTLAYLLWRTRDGQSMSPEDAAQMMSLSPLARVRCIASDKVEAKRIHEITDLYAWFLEMFSGTRADSLHWVGKSENWLEARTRGAVFADSFHELIIALGSESQLYRYLLV